MSRRIVQVLAVAALTAFASCASAEESTQEAKFAPTLAIWKTITVGLYSNVDAVRDALERAHISIGDWADEILGRPGFTFNDGPRELNLVVLSVAELGFGGEGGTLADVHARALRLGLELCLDEVAPHLRLQYLDQPVGEFLHIAMQPRHTYAGEPVDFTLGNGGAGLALLGGSARPDLVLARNVVLVFAFPSYQARSR